MRISDWSSDVCSSDLLLIVKGADGGLVGIALRGDHQLNEIKAAKHPKVASPLTMAAPAEVLKVFGCEVGYLGPVGAPVPVIADYAAAEIAAFVCGANDNDHHLSGVNWARDCAEPEAADQIGSASCRERVCPYV